MSVWSFPTNWIITLDTFTSIPQYLPNASELFTFFFFFFFLTNQKIIELTSLILDTKGLEPGLLWFLKCFLYKKLLIWCFYVFLYNFNVLILKIKKIYYFNIFLIKNYYYKNNLHMIIYANNLGKTSNNAAFLLGALFKIYFYI